MSNFNEERIRELTDLLAAANDNVQRVYNAGCESGRDEGYRTGFSEGKSAGVSEGYSSGFENGKRNEYDLFWDRFQDYGNKRSYCDPDDANRQGGGFSGFWWNKDIFKPKYNIIAEGLAAGMFQFFNNNGDAPIDMAEILRDQGVIMDLSEVTDLSSAFRFCNISSLPTLDLSNATNIKHMFSYCPITWIEKIISTENTNWESTIVFDYVLRQRLDHCPFEGVIAKSLRMTGSQYLDKESIVSIINALSPDVTDKRLVLNWTAIAKAFETSEGADDGRESDEWVELVATKPNWTIAY